MYTVEAGWFGIWEFTPFYQHVFSSLHVQFLPCNIHYAFKNKNGVTVLLNIYQNKIIKIT